MPRCVPASSVDAGRAVLVGADGVAVSVGRAGWQAVSKIKSSNEDL